MKKTNTYKCHTLSVGVKKASNTSGTVAAGDINPEPCCKYGLEGDEILQRIGKSYTVIVETTTTPELP